MIRRMFVCVSIRISELLASLAVSVAPVPISGVRSVLSRVASAYRIGMTCVTSLSDSGTSDGSLPE